MRRPVFEIVRPGKTKTACAVSEVPSEARMSIVYTSSGNHITQAAKTKAVDQGPVVQSVVSLTSSLRVISLTVLADSIYNILIFFAEKMWVAFALQKLLTFFQQKISAYLRITQLKF